LKQEYTAFIEQNQNYREKLKFLSRVFMWEVEREQFDSLPAVVLLFDNHDRALAEGVIYLKKFIAAPPPDALTELAVDYAKMFAGFAKDCPFPYESVYTSEERLMMQEARDEVLELYRQEKFEAYLQNSEPEDHLANELEFMVFLNQKMAENLIDGEMKLALKYQDKQKGFLETHLNNWVPLLCKDMEKMAQTDFYRGIAKITPATLTSLTKLLSADLR